MHSSVRSILAISLAAVGSACYHATIETGLPASSETIAKPWAHSFLWGLVPPATVESASKCKSGVAKVETQWSFVNGLASFITGGIYSPMQIDVTCASSGKVSLGASDSASSIQAADRSPAAMRTALVQAAAASEQLRQPVLVRF